MILITGGTGFIGAHLLYYLVKRGTEVLALKRSSSNLDYIRKVFSSYVGESDAKELFDQIEWVEADITDYSQLLAIEPIPDFIWHCAGYVSFDPAEKNKIFKTNIGGTANVVNYALEKGIGKLGYISSVAALDAVADGDYVTETHFGNVPQRSSAYAESKFKAELEVWRGIEEGLDAIIVNPSVVIGPGFPDGGISKILERGKKGLKFFPAGKTGFVDIRDVCRVSLMLDEMKIYNERFILSENNYSYQKLFEFINEDFGHNPPKKYLRPWLTALAWKLERIRSTLLNSSPLLTRETHHAAHNQVLFSNMKIREQLHYEFIPVRDSVSAMVSSVK